MPRPRANGGSSTESFPPPTLDAETDAFAARILRSSPAVVALGKHAFYAQEGDRETEAYALTCGVMVENAQIDDAAGGHARVPREARAVVVDRRVTAGR